MHFNRINEIDPKTKSYFLFNLYENVLNEIGFLSCLFFAYLQSQPCHWRNIKSVTKRDVSNVNKTIATEVVENGKKEKSVSDNISLFQSLRVLQEGEGDEFSSAVQSKYDYQFYVSISNHSLDKRKISHLQCHLITNYGIDIRFFDSDR